MAKNKTVVVLKKATGKSSGGVNTPPKKAVPCKSCDKKK